MSELLSNLPSEERVIDPVQLAIDAHAELRLAANSGVFDHDKVAQLGERIAAMRISQADKLEQTGPESAEDLTLN